MGLLWKTWMMRVNSQRETNSLLFCSQYFPSPGERGRTGGIISNLNFLRAAAKEFNVTVLSFDRTSRPRDFSGEPFSFVHRPAPNLSALEILRNWRRFVEEQVAEQIRAQRASAIITGTSSLAAFNVASEGMKCIAIVQAFENFGFRCPWVPMRSRARLVKGAIVRRFQDGKLLCSADAVLTNSVFMKQAIIRRFRLESSRVHILPQQVDVIPSAAPPPPNSVGFVHRGADKNIALIAQIARRAPDLQFFVFGHQRELPSNLPANIEIKGWHSDRDAMFSSVALWLVPSLWAEPFGRVSIEAQAADRAVLVARRGGLPETVVDDRFCLAGYDPDIWLGRIRSLMTLPQCLLAQNGSIIRHKFSAAIHDRRVVDAITHILEN